MYRAGGAGRGGGAAGRGGAAGAGRGAGAPGADGAGRGKVKREAGNKMKSARGGSAAARRVR